MTSGMPGHQLAPIQFTFQQAVDAKEKLNQPHKCK